MLSGVKPLIDRLRAETQGTDIDPEALMEIFIDWGDALINNRHFHDNASTWEAFKTAMKAGQ